MKSLRKILWPFAVIYDGVTRIRNIMYDHDMLASQAYDFPVLGVGNLSVGGTGKTPMTEYIIRLCRGQKKVGVLSRGYGRKTSGYKNVTSQSNASEVGDEPLQFARKFQNVIVAVDEDRRHGIQKMQNLTPNPTLIILDDVYQHRAVRPGFLILLSSYEDLFYTDFVLPAGNLRESRLGAHRANCIVITKVPKDIDVATRNEISARVKEYSDAPVFFSSITYSNQIYSSNTIQDLNYLKGKNPVLVTGIANPNPLIKYLNEQQLAYKHIAFKDHHNFTPAELTKLDGYEYILTTEKDYMRLANKMTKAQVYYLPIAIDFVEKKDDFDNLITQFINTKT